MKIDRAESLNDDATFTVKNGFISPNNYKANGQWAWAWAMLVWTWTIVINENDDCWLVFLSIALNWDYIGSLRSNKWSEKHKSDPTHRERVCSLQHDENVNTKIWICICTNGTSQNTHSFVSINTFLYFFFSFFLHFARVIRLKSINIHILLVFNKMQSLCFVLTIHNTLSSSSSNFRFFSTFWLFSYSFARKMCIFFMFIVHLHVSSF